MAGTVGILNVGAGDTKLTFDPTKPDEVKRSAQIVKDMIRRGFVLLIEVGQDKGEPIYKRAHDFDESTAEYIVAGVAEPTTEEQVDEQEQAGAPPTARKAAPRRAKRRTRERIPATGTRALAVARTAGG
jgi:hypothetical protein